jgi:hypothetical protein
MTGTRTVTAPLIDDLTDAVLWLKQHRQQHLQQLSNPAYDFLLGAELALNRQITACVRGPKVAR